MKNVILASVFVLVGAVAACSAQDGRNGTNGVGSPGAPGPSSTVAGPQGPAGPVSTVPGPSGSAGAKGDRGEVGASGDAGVSLCGDQPMPEWHQQCGLDLLGACSSPNLRWECHARLGDNGDVEQFKVCADATKHFAAPVNASQSSEYPNNPVATSSGRCDEDADCDGQPDLLTDTVSYTDTMDGTTTVTGVKVGDALALSAVVNYKVVCQNTTAVCDDMTRGNTGHIVAGAWVDAANSASLNLDCFNSTTGLEQAMACSLDGTTWFGYTDDGDATDTCERLEGEGQIGAGTAQVSCVAPGDTYQCL